MTCWSPRCPAFPGSLSGRISENVWQSRAYVTGLAMSGPSRLPTCLPHSGGLAVTGKCACWEEGGKLIFIFFCFVKEPIVHEINKGEMHIKILGPLNSVR